jgi:hypothetical protein
VEAVAELVPVGRQQEARLHARHDQRNGADSQGDGGARGEPANAREVLRERKRGGAGGGGEHEAHHAHTVRVRDEHRVVRGAEGAEREEGDEAERQLATR